MKLAEKLILAQFLKNCLIKNVKNQIWMKLMYFFKNIFQMNDLQIDSL